MVRLKIREDRVGNARSHAIARPARTTRITGAEAAVRLAQGLGDGGALGMGSGPFVVG